MRIILTILVSAVLLAGCSKIEAKLQAKREQAARTETNKILAECENKRLNGALNGLVAEHNCGRYRIRLAWADADYPDMDLIDIWLNYDYGLAKAVDAQELSEHQAEIKGREFDMWFSSEVSAREARREQARAARRATALMIFYGTQAGYQSGANTYRGSATCLTTLPPSYPGQSTVFWTSCY